MSFSTRRLSYDWKGPTVLSARNLALARRPKKIWLALMRASKEALGKRSIYTPWRKSINIPTMRRINLKLVD